MTTTPADTTGHNVRAEMARRGVKQIDLAAELGLSQTGVSKRLLGKTPFTINEIAIVAAFLNVPLTQLLPIEETAVA